MIQPPKSLTAIVHMRFQYQEPETRPAGEGEIELISNILEQAADLPPDLQATLLQFADYLSKLGQKTREEVSS